MTETDRETIERLTRELAEALATNEELRRLRNEALDSAVERAAERDDMRAALAALEPMIAEWREHSGDWQKKADAQPKAKLVDARDARAQVFAFCADRLERLLDGAAPSAPAIERDEYCDRCLKLLSEHFGETRAGVLHTGFCYVVRADEWKFVPSGRFPVSATSPSAPAESGGDRGIAEEVPRAITQDGAARLWTMLLDLADRWDESVAIKFAGECAFDLRNLLTLYEAECVAAASEEPAESASDKERG